MIKELVPGFLVLILKENLGKILDDNAVLLDCCNYTTFLDRNEVEYVVFIPYDGLFFAEKNGLVIVENGTRFPDEYVSHMTNIPFVLT